MASSPSTVNVGNYVTVKPSMKGDDRIINYKIWKKQMLCLLQSQDVVGFVNGEIAPPPPPEENEDDEEQKEWRRTDGLIQGWILGSIGKDALHAVWEKPTARDIWLKLENFFKREEEKEEEKEKKKKEDSEKEDIDYSRYCSVYQAAMRGECETIKNFFQDINEVSTTLISSKSETALHIAVLTGKANGLVSKLVELMPCEALALKDSSGATALHNAATVGNKAAAYALVNEDPNLLLILNKHNRLPVQEAVRSCQKETLEYLIAEHEANAEQNLISEGQLGLRLLNATITSEFVDIAFNLAHKYPSLTLLTSEDDGRSALSTIARTATLFPRTDTLRWWQKFIYHRIPLKKTKREAAQTRDLENLSSDGAARNSLFQIISLFQLGQKLESMIWYVIENLVPKVNEVREKKARREQALQLAHYLCDQIVSLPQKEASKIFRESISQAATYGISEIVEMIIHKFPMVTFHSDTKHGRNILLQAARYRFENVISLIYSMSDRRYVFFDTLDYKNNNVMHICGKLASPHRLNLVAGAALQMQRDLQWFKEMENFVHPSRRIWRNKENQTPQMIFTKEHEKLKADGERWMKDTANACTIAAALIATVVFAAVFTVPGGVEPSSGIPLLKGNHAFDVFVVSDIISLFTSITSLLMFLSILTARYAEEDFLYVLPKRLCIGLLSLFVSITFMLLAFTAILHLLLQRDIAWYVVLVAGFACLPVASFVLLQFPLLVDVVSSTYGPGIFARKGEGLLY